MDVNFPLLPNLATFHYLSEFLTKMKSTTLFNIAITCIFSTVSAVPAVTPTLLSAGDCYDYPQRFEIVVDSSDDPAINGLPAQPYDIIFPSKTLPLLAIDLRASHRIAKYIYACTAGAPVVASSPEFKKLNICQDRQNGHILIDAPAEKTLVPELYRHTIDGNQVDGMYLGVKNQTTWGFRYNEASCWANATVSTRDYYEVKLMGLPSSEWDTAGYEVEFEGFLKIRAW